MQGTAAITNATENTKENTWYQVSTKINNDEVTTNLSYENGTVIESTKQYSNSPAVLLLTNNEDEVVAIKNLTIQNQNANPQPQNTQKTTSIPGNPYFALYVVISVLTAASLAAALYVKKGKKTAANQSTR